MAKDTKFNLQIVINGKAVEHSLNGVYNRMRKVKNELRKLKPGTKAFAATSKDLKALQDRYSKINHEINGTESRLKKLTKGAGSFLAVFGIGVGIASVFRFFKNITAANVALNEAQADVMKTTGQTRTQVTALTVALKKIDTKTAINDLLGLAAAGGRLNLKGNDLLDFVTNTDKAFIALGDSLDGSAEEIGLTLGKIAGSFDLEEKYGVGEAINKIGSSLNELGAKSKASEGPIVDFTKRLAGVSAQAKISLPNIAALGALFDENGQSVEVASSTFNKLLPAIGKDVKKFAGIAGVSVKSFTKTLEDDAFEALKLVAKGAKSNQKGLLGLTKTLESYGINSARSASIVGLLSSKTERLTELQEISNTAFENGTSLTNEFNLKNNTLGAILDKIGNTIAQKFTGSGLQDFLKSLAFGFLNIVRNSGKLIEKFKGVLKIISIVTIGLFSYSAALKLAALWTKTAAKQTILHTLATKAHAAGLVIAKGAVFAYKIILAVLSGNLKKATIAMRAFSIATKLNPIGLLVGIIAAAATAIALYSKTTEAASVQQKSLNDLKKKATAIYTDETSSLTRLLSVAKDENLSKEQRVAAIKQLNELSPKYLGDLTTETINTKKATEAIDLYIAAMKRRAEQKALEQLIDETVKTRQEEAAKGLKDHTKWYDYLTAAVTGFGNAHLGAANMVVIAAKRKAEALNALSAKEKTYTDEYKKLLVEQSAAGDPVVVTPTVDDIETTTEDTIVDGDGLTEKDKQILASKKRLKELLAENKLEEDALRLEEEMLAAETLEEKTNLEFERLKWIAQQELKIQKDKELESLKSINATAEELKAVEDKYRLKEDALTKKLDKEKAKAEAKLKKDKQASDVKALKDEEFLAKQRIQAYSNMFGNIAQLLGEHTAAGKAAAIAQATINTYQGISEVWRAKSVLPEPFGTAAKVVSTGVVLASGLKSVGAIKGTKTGFYEGGPTGDKPIYNDQYGAVTGVVHDNEWVAPKFMTESPRYAPTIQWLETERKKELGQYFDGGNTSETSVPEFSNEPEEPTENNSTNIAMMQLLQKLDSKLDEGFKGYMVRDYEEFLDRKEQDEEYKQIFENTRS